MVRNRTVALLGWALLLLGGARRSALVAGAALLLLVMASVAEWTVGHYLFGDGLGYAVVSSRVGGSLVATSTNAVPIALRDWIKPSACSVFDGDADLGVALFQEAHCKAMAGLSVRDAVAVALGSAGSIPYLGSSWTVVPVGWEGRLLPWVFPQVAALRAGAGVSEALGAGFPSGLVSFWMAALWLFAGLVASGLVAVALVLLWLAIDGLGRLGSGWIEAANGRALARGAKAFALLEERRLRRMARSGRGRSSNGL